MLTDEIAFALAQFFDRIGPSHDEITTLVRRAGFEALDPMHGPGEPIGKMRRVRTVLTTAAEPSSADRLVIAFVQALRSHGSFVRDTPDFPGEDRFRALREAFRTQGYELSTDGQLLPLSLDALDGVRLGEALEAYVRRALRGGDDSALLIGTGKDLIEACARYALEETTGSYPNSANFEATLWQAYDRLGLAPPDHAVLATLDPDPEIAMQQAVWILAVAENRLRNRLGTGHGRPRLEVRGPDLGRFAAQAAGLVSRLLLDRVAELKRRRVA